MDAERFAVIEDREKGLRRGLTSAQLSMIAIGGAIGTGLFLGSSFAIGFAGPSVIVSYVIGALIALLLMGCLAEMTVAHPTSGSFGAWAEVLYLTAGRVPGSLCLLVVQRVRGGRCARPSC
jgi:amino acid transporter, AAT family